MQIKIFIAAYLMRFPLKRRLSVTIYLEGEKLIWELGWAWSAKRSEMSRLKWSILFHSLNPQADGQSLLQMALEEVKASR